MTRKHILAATDGSRTGQHAVAIARRLATDLGAGLDVLRVVHGTDSPRVDAEGTQLRTGIPGIEIVRRAEEIGADLLVLGRFLRGSAAHPQLGLTADAVVRRSQVPCLFVPENQNRFAQLFAAADGTERGLRVLDEAHQLLSWTEAVRWSAVTVEPQQGGEPDVGAAKVALPSAREERLRGWMLHRGDGEAARMDLVVLSGDPVTGILGQIENSQDALLVVGNHRGGPAGVVASTGVGRALLYRAPCAVVTIPL
ncbi:MAG: hypothetical protein CVV20_00520 [Gemmatimonadetes bacterium HGW-Gemmatimonadetes-1]|nr:MAG: hypothetical protein CVV20_00520 [Gemmatimonadetes bacterium HGW-Gemmatimonadetes-1]